MIVNPWKQIESEGALFVKNPWGLSVEQQGLVDLDITFDATQGGMKANIDFDFSAVELNPAIVKAFPQFTIGYKDVALEWPENYEPNNIARGMNLMQFIGQHYILSFDTQTKASGQCNIASEIFLYSDISDGPQRDNPNLQEYEVMLWVDSPTDESIGLGTAVHEAEGYKVYAKQDNKRYMAIVMDKGFVSDTQTEVHIQWSKTMAFARAIAANLPTFFDPIKDTWKVYGIETGLEIWGGKGSTYFSNILMSQRVTGSNFFASNTYPEPVNRDDNSPVLEDDLDPSMDMPRRRALDAVVGCLFSTEISISDIVGDNEGPLDLLSPELMILMSHKAKSLADASNLINLEQQRLQAILNIVRQNLQANQTEQANTQGSQNG